MTEVRNYIHTLPEEARKRLWLETETSREFPDLWTLPLDDFLDVLAPELHSEALGPIRRAARRREERLDDADEETFNEIRNA